MLTKKVSCNTKSNFPNVSSKVVENILRSKFIILMKLLKILTLFLLLILASNCNESPSISQTKRTPISKPSIPEDSVPLNEEAKAFRINETKPLLRVFFASWCVSCKDEIPHLTKLIEKYPDLQIQGIAVISDKNEVIKTIKQLNIKIPVFFTNKDIEYFGLPGTPSHILYSADGHEIWRESGMILLHTPEGFEYFDLAIKEKLKNKTQSFIWSDKAVWNSVSSNSKKSMILDVRTIEEWSSGHIENATHIPLDNLEFQLNEIPKDIPILLYCKSGARSTYAANVLTKKGYSKLYNLKGGIDSWR